MFSTRQAAKMLGLGAKTLSHYIAVGKVPAPTILKVGSASLHAWSDDDIERVRQLLPKIANGRKTRWKKKQLAASNKQFARPKVKTKGKTKGKTKKKSKSPRSQSTG